ncbi:MAG: type II toxin-antitoxin system RelB/DinJ family antitoxin [Eubacteriales bacterium]|nr:type II toxin-antitoxin system RelB/DinJ family antitoxin [Eubacteriales bacterium]
MASETVLQVRMDKETKDEVESLYRAMGITFASAVRLFAKQSIIEQGLPFLVSQKPVNAAGMLNKYAKKSKRKLEESAYEKGVIEKYKKNN